MLLLHASLCLFIFSVVTLSANQTTSTVAGNTTEVVNKLQLEGQDAFAVINV
jgi:hypothetical protein